MIMLLSEVKDEEHLKKLIEDKDYIAELKADGQRVQLQVTDGHWSLYSRDGEFKKELPKEIKEQLDKIPNDKSFIVDGELTFIDDKGKHHRSQAQSPEAEPVLFLWDCLRLDYEDLTERPYLERKVELEGICNELEWKLDFSSYIRFLPHFVKKQELLDAAYNLELEGIVFKDIKGKYVDGRSDSQFKYKFTKTDEYIVIGYTEAEGTKTGKREQYFKALMLAQYKDGVLKSKGMVGGGVTDEDLIEITPKLQKDKYKIDTREYQSKPKIYNLGHNFNDKNYRQTKNSISWLKKNDWFVIEIKMSGLTEYNNPFQPRFLGIRTDKTIDECIER